MTEAVPTYVVIVTDATGKEWQATMRGYAEAEVEDAVRRESRYLRSRGLGHVKVEARRLEHERG